MIRRHVIGTAKKDAEGHFGSGIGFVLLEPDEGRLPAYQVFVDLLSVVPVQNGNFSRLVCCWFEDTAPEKLVECIAMKIQNVDWNKRATDGYY